MKNFVEITSNDNWFKLHPEKIAGVEYETTSFYFPIMVKGTKEDVLRVTGMNNNSKKLALAKAKAKALKVKLSLGQLGVAFSIKQRIKALVVYAFENRNTSKNKIEEINLISENEANILKEKTGFDFTGYKRILDKSSIIHTFNTHGNQKVEEKRGQIAITKEDFELIPKIVKTNNISNLEKSKNGSICITYETIIGDTYYYVEEIRTGRKHLCLKTMYKRKTNHEK